MSRLPRRQVVVGEFSHCFTWLAVSAASVTPVRKSSKKSPIRSSRSRGSRSIIWFARRSLSWISGRISQRIVVAVIGSLPLTLEVFYRHAGPGASVVHALATLREDYFDGPCAPPRPECGPGARPPRRATGPRNHQAEPG